MPRVYPPLEGRQPSVTISPSLVESVAGFSAGVVSTLFVHPFDVVKTRLQLERDPIRQGATWRVVKKIAAESAQEAAQRGQSQRPGIASIVNSFYRGLMPNMIGNSVSWGLYFMWYGNIKDLVRAARGTGEGRSRQLNSSDYFLASGLAGILTAVFTNPIWVIKTRMLSTSRHDPLAYRSMAHGITDIYRDEGLRGFYRGLLPSLFGVSHGAIQFMAYEQLKNRWARRPDGTEGNRNLSNLDYLYLSAVSKIFAGTITYPYQVIRARLQARGAPPTVSAIVRDLLVHEGPRGFYKGLGPNILRVLPSTCVTFLVYENMKFYLPRMLSDELDDEQHL